MKTELQQLQDEIEQHIDRNSLSGIMDIIATICREKADHLQVNWGNRESAKVWAKAARQIEKAASGIDI